MSDARRCPECGKPVLQRHENRAYPFCSRRCQLLDLGNWLSGAYRVPGPPAELPDQPDENRGHEEHHEESLLH